MYLKRGRSLSASNIKHIEFTECFEGDNTVQIPLCQIPLCVWLFQAYLRRIVHEPQSRQRHTTERKRERKLKVGMKSFWKVTNFNPEWKKYFAILPEKLCSQQELNILKTPRIRVYAVFLCHCCCYAWKGQFSSWCLSSNISMYVCEETTHSNQSGSVQKTKLISIFQMQHHQMNTRIYELHNQFCIVKFKSLSLLLVFNVLLST